MDTAKLVVLYTCFSSKEEALSVSQKLIEEKLVACANILSPIVSLYKWEGEIQQNEEVATLLKTSLELAQKTMSRIEDLHSYETPCVIELKSGLVAKNFQAWVLDQIQES